MTKSWGYFEEFLWDSFREGGTVRELRLSQDELSYLKGRYPIASCQEAGASHEGKAWYQITLRRRCPLSAQGA